VFFISVAVLYGLAALGGTWKPQLGLDLEGGTRITLTTLSNVNATKMKQAASIIDARVNGSGVSEAEVTTQGNKNIVVEIPGKNSKSLVDSVKRTAQLRFRLVYGSGQPGVLATGTPSASPSGSPAASPSGSPAASPGATTTPEASSPSATPKPRVAPDFAAAKKKKPSPTPTPTATPLVPTPSPSAPPAQTKNGASIDDPLAWVKDPGLEWLAKYQAFTCPPKGQESAPIADNPDQPLITCDENGLKYLLSKAVIEGTSLSSASAGIPQNSTSWAVMLKLKGDARKTFANISRELFNNGGQFAIVLDGKVLSAPGFEGVITDGNAQITGSFSESEATSLANSLKYGALPVRFAQPTVEVVGPSLAGDQLSAGIYAGIVGLLIVMLYCLLYYRGLGLVVIASLVVAALVTYAIVLVLAKAAGFTLTLPGIAGLIVAVGITADSFIVYFERMRDEMRAGKSMRVAVEAAWLRARNTCLAADAVSFLAAIVLYIFAIGVVRGFAFALGISTLIDVAVFFWFTKPVVTLLARRTFFNSGNRYSGLSRETLGVDVQRGRTTRLAGGQA
jgi:preprotein translocase subunit SecD